MAVMMLLDLSDGGPTRNVSLSVGQSPAEFPALRSLGLAESDFAALQKNGTVLCEQRHKRPVHRLRFRRGGRQVARAIGGSAQAQQVRAVLACCRGHGTGSESFTLWPPLGIYFDSIKSLLARCWPSSALLSTAMRLGVPVVYVPASRGDQNDRIN